MTRINERLSDATYIELVRSLFTTMLTTLIMTISFVVVGNLTVAQTPDGPLEILIAAGTLAAVARIVVLFAFRREVAADRLDAAAAHRLERWFAVIYLIFAAIFGAFTARAFAIATPETHSAVVGLLFGYGAGVAAGVALRPWIGISAMTIAVVPTVIAAALKDEVSYWATSGVLALFLFGGIYSLVGRYRITVRGISMRQLFETLARHDALTGLPNRLSLREYFGTAAGRAAGDMIAVHCLDLDRFKPVNDQYGHPTGDALLKAVSGRLQGVLREGDMVARLGGDEFVVVQTGIHHAGEAELLARRIVKTVAQPYSIDGHVLSVGTSVGFALSPDHGTDLDRLTTLADEALVEVKRTGGGIACYNSPKIEAERRLSA